MRLFFIISVFQVHELNLFFGKIIDRLSPNKNFQHYYPELQSIIEKVVAHTQDFELLFAMVIIIDLLFSTLPSFIYIML